MSEKKTDSETKKNNLGSLEEDDEFEEFPADDWDDEDQEPEIYWEERWDDDNIEEDFTIQLEDVLKTQK